MLIIASFLFVKLFSGGKNTQDLAELRKIKTPEMSITSKTGIDPQKIPPRADAASFILIVCTYRWLIGKY